MATTVKKARKTAGQKKALETKAMFPRPGVIQEIVHMLEQAKEHDRPLTVEQMLTKLAKKFPDRDIKGMEVTIRAQLSRLPRERGFDIEKERDGRVCHYRAA